MVCSADESRPRQGGVQYAEIVIGGKSSAAAQAPGKDVVLNMPPTAAHHLQQAEQQVHAKTEAEDTKKRAWLLAYCFLGIMVSFTLNGLVLEKITTHRVLGEMSLTFVFCLFYAVVALGLRAANKEKPSTMPQSMLAIVGVLAFGSTISSMVALRYVTFITRILGKSCKSIPVMLVGVLLGKTFAFKKYLSVMVLSIGVAIFLVGTAHEKQHRAVQHNEEHDHMHEHERTPNMFLGISLLLVSLLFDGATGALEDKYMEKYHIGAFDLMYVVNIYKCVFSAVGMVVMGEVPEFLEYVVPSLPNLVLLSLTGAMGQAFIFYTISKFGALTTSIIGTCRKVLSIVLSVIMFGHILSFEQTIGLALSFVGIGLNWVRINTNCLSFGKKKNQAAQAELELGKLHDLEASDLLFESSDDTADSEEENSSETSSPTSDEESPLRNKEVERGLELVNAWARQSQQQLAENDDDDEKKTALVSDGDNLAAQAV
jgi:UDP-galactose transporter B1